MYWQSEKKLVKQQYLLHMFSQCGELQSTNGWDQFGSVGTTSNFNRFRILPSLLQRCCLPEANQASHDVWPSPGLVHWFLAALAPDIILPGAEFTLHPSLLFSYIGSVTAQDSSSGRQQNCGVVQGMELRNFRRGRHLFRLGSHYVRHRHTF